MKKQLMKKQPKEKAKIETPTMFDALIKERMKERKVFVLERTAPARRARDLHTSLVAGHVTAGLKRQLDEIRNAAEVSDVASQPLKTFNELDGNWTAVQLQNHFAERLRFELESHPMIVKVPTGSRVIGPPYDAEWSEGAGFAFGSRHDGELSTLGIPGFSASGVGFYLSSPVPVSAEVTPMGSYDFNWISFADQPSLHSRGGLGVVVYEGEQEVMSREVVLWSVSGVKIWMSENGTGLIADAANSVEPSKFGPFRLAPFSLNMVPGVRYLVWVWCWQIMQKPESSSGLFAFLKMQMPFVKVDFRPPLVPPK